MALQIYNVTGSMQQLIRRMERKFYIAPDMIEQARGWLQHVCCEDKEFPFEQINSLYFDTPDLDQHVRSLEGDFRKDKVRIRWYGNEQEISGHQTAFLELKSRRGFASYKQRLKLTLPSERLALVNLHEGIVNRELLNNTLARFGYFPEGLLIPVIRICYLRYRFVEVFSGQQVALDCRIRSTFIKNIHGRGERDLELSGAVLEVKGDSMELPLPLIKAKTIGLDWTRFSKYSSCIEAHMEAAGTQGRFSPSGRIIDS